jgi:Uma2 family endonuclease
MATAEKLLTAEEFKQLPDDGKRYELIDGELREMVPTVNWHGEVESNLTALLHMYVRSHGLGRVSCGEVMYIVRRHPDRVRAADIAFLCQERVSSLEARQHIMEITPDLVVEILSTHDTIAAISDRIDDWLGAGVRLLWIVDPFRRTVTIYQPERDPTLLGAHATLEGEAVLPGFRCPVAEMFA